MAYATRHSTDILFAVVQLRGIGLGALIQEFATALIGLVIFGLALLLLFMRGRGYSAPTRYPQITHSELEPADRDYHFHL